MATNMNRQLPHEDTERFSAPLVAWMVVLADRPLTRLIDVASATATLLHGLYDPIDRWLTERQRAADDWQLLANMNDHELQDIGVPRASVRAVAQDRWARDRSA